MSNNWEVLNEYYKLTVVTAIFYLYTILQGHSSSMLTSLFPSIMDLIN